MTDKAITTTNVIEQVIIGGDLGKSAGRIVDQVCIVEDGINDQIKPPTVYPIDL